LLVKYPEVLSLRSEPVEFSYTEEDVILYALGVGVGTDSLEDEELQFVYEKRLCALPTMSTALLRGSNSLTADAGIDAKMMLHSEQRMIAHRPLPPAGRIRSGSRVFGVSDKGKGKGAAVYMEHSIADANTGILYSTLVLTLFCRGDGGFGGPATSPFPLHELPARPCDAEIALKTAPNQAALYRIAMRDRTPLHIDPEVAAAAGFDKPLLHGLCTYGFACRAVMKACCNNDPAKIRSFDVRFTSPVFPGETLVTRIWKDGSVVSFESSVLERDVTVLKNGRCEIVQ
jgi:acyl dehydratase